MERELINKLRRLSSVLRSIKLRKDDCDDVSNEVGGISLCGGKLVLSRYRNLEMGEEGSSILLDDEIKEIEEEISYFLDGEYGERQLELFCDYVEGIVKLCKEIEA
jgi:hypothetical protein